MTIPANVLNKDSISGLICCLHIIYTDGDGVTDSIKLCNWSEPISIKHEFNVSPEIFTPYPFKTPNLAQDVGKELPTLQIQLPITRELWYLVKANTQYILGSTVNLYYTNTELLAIGPDRHIDFKFFLNNIGLTNESVVLDLSVRYNQMVKVPHRKFRRNYCAWAYKNGIDCVYDPAELTDLPISARFWDFNNNPLDDGLTVPVASALDACSKTLAACRLRQKATMEATSYALTPHKRWYLLPFGGFPAAPTRDPRRVF